MKTRFLRPLAVGAAAACLLARPAEATSEEAPPRPACVAVDTCTLVHPLSTADGIDTVALVDRVVQHVDPKQAFAGWLAWAHAPAALRAQVWHGASLRLERATEMGTFLLRAVPAVRLAEPQDALLVLVTFDPFRTGTPSLPEAISIAQERKLLTAEQERRVARESEAQRARSKSVTDAWLSFSRAPADVGARNRLLSALGSDASGLEPATFLTPEQRTALRRAGLALDGHIVLEDVPGHGVAYRLLVEGVPLQQVVREWNAGLSALVNPLERVPRPLLVVAPAQRNDEVSFSLDVMEGDEDRMSQLVRRLLAVPGISTEGKQLPPPGL